MHAALRLLPLALTASLYGCSGKDASARLLDDATAAAAQGQWTPAVFALQSVCWEAPAESVCTTATLRLGQVRLQAAEQARAGGDFFEVQRQTTLALVGPDETTRQKAEQMLASDEVKKGIVAQHARGLSATPGVPPGHDRDEKRLRPLRKEAEAFLYVFAAAEKKRVEFDTCLERTGDNPTGELLTNLCREEIYQDASEDGYRTRYTKERTDEYQWRRLLREMHDDALTQEYEQKKMQAVADAKNAAERAVGGH